jgi:hypothetical protein
VENTKEELYCAPKEFFEQVYSLLSWIAVNEWSIDSDEDKELCENLYKQSREIIYGE